MKSYRRINAVKISVDILKYLADQREPVSGQEIATSTGITYGTAMCHLATLEDTGLVQIVGDSYELGMGMAMFWAKMRDQETVRRDEADRNLKAMGA